MALSKEWKEKWLDKLIYTVLICVVGYVFWKYPPAEEVAKKIIAIVGEFVEYVAKKLNIHLPWSK